MIRRPERVWNVGDEVRINGNDGDAHHPPIIPAIAGADVVIHAETLHWKLFHLEYEIGHGLDRRS